MFESMTYEYILNRMLNNAPSGIDKREGSIIYDALAPAAAELAQAYINLDIILTETYGLTASREYLIRRAAERGLIPEEATYAVAKGQFNIAVAIGSRFNIDKYNYAVTELISDTDHTYKMVCETSGNEPNSYVGKMIPIEYIDGLKSAELTEILIPGEDVEDTEVFRLRYKASFNNQAFGGNIADYKQKVKALDGVGGVKVYRAKYGAGTVGITFSDSENKVPSAELVNVIQTAVDPVVNTGEGLGIAPIDHRVTVSAVTGRSLAISTSITYSEGWSFVDAQPYIETVIDEYFSGLNATWESNTALIVRISQIESRLLDLDAVLDITGTTIEGTAANCILGADEIAVRGSVTDVG